MKKSLPFFCVVFYTECWFPLHIHLLKLGSIGEDQWTERRIAQCKLIQLPKKRCWETPWCGTCHHFVKNERSVIKMMKVCITLWSLYIFQRGGLKPQFPKRFKLPHACKKKRLLDLNHILLIGTKASSSVLCQRCSNTWSAAIWCYIYSCGGNHFYCITLYCL